ncbi:ABC-type transport system involved in multi-copper enzyme maturation permease subunit [Parabacteroides sp. PF5-5]|uniref:ABC transporter permease subunit n=1 Tax=unclassified Parabacteroides TaxID=2649774 RepID=UPI002474B227|nr:MULTISPECIES: ABC transporter permease subunit [unclassified Parabacteroides]MDH6303896.1 ABC-type transport system involved in multi-copper enzyme maturation permease subunit [Parabacteroides sp. PH5-39]MDH6314513.1 ABC-type transport system involved in multi-copper enzyme maturation permease subunit [Parabacteroides sp. PF5-13]MDH6318422.1 ABC-type transport system involved in multi-copper enzyme maturation permease subunit [Parabacteroides sp. PH5-13]MDH6322285.1 ABC-type transport system
MIWLIAKKDFLLNLLSVRFIIGFVLCLVIIPFTIIVSVDDYLAKQNSYEIESKQAADELSGHRVWSAVRPTVVTKPEPLSIFSSGISANLGNRVKIAFDTYPLFPTGHTVTQDNPLLNAFFSIDFSRVVAILISLIALVFAYDTITREREDGTMKLSLTGQVSRISFLFGKLLGLILTLLPILLFCYLLACLIIILNPAISFSATDWGSIALMFLISMFYMLIFILLGMLISSLVKRSSSSIILSLLCWIWFLFLMPNISTYLSQSIAKTPLYDNVQVAISEYEKEFYEKDEERQKQLNDEMGGDVWVVYWNANMGRDGFLEFSGTLKEAVEHARQMQVWKWPTALDYADKKWVLQRDYLDKMLSQQRLQQTIAFFSPSEIFRQTTEILCHTSVDDFQKYMESVRNYRETVIRYFADNKLYESLRYFTVQTWDQFPSQKEFDRSSGSIEDLFTVLRKIPADQYEPLNLDNLPRFEARQATIFSMFADALGRMAVMIGLGILLLLGTILSFMRYDVR